MILLKEITIRYNTYAEYKKDDRGSHISVLVDGEPIKNLKSFSIDVDADELEPVFTVKRHMAFPCEDDEYNHPLKN